MSPHFFIDRPIFASVLSIVISLFGLIAIQNLPISQFPQITPPTVQVDANYPGASPDIVANSVAGVIERELPGIDNLLYYSSTNTSDGHMSLTLTFEIGTNLDIAALQTQNRVKLAEPRLPQEVVRQGITVKKQSANFLGVIALGSTDPRHDSIFLANYAIRNVVDRIKRVPGVGDASVFGQQDYSMRIILDPVRMAQLQLTPNDIVTAIQEQNREFPAGSVGREPAMKGTQLTIPLMTRGRFSEVKEFEDVIVRAQLDGSMIRLKDVARMELGAQSYVLSARVDGEPTTVMVANLSPGANALGTMQRVKAELNTLAKSFPAGMSYHITYNTTLFVETSIREVVKTLLEALVLVVLVVYLFLQSWRATLIPAIAIPVSLLGAFVGMQLLGFSINTLTLFGMVLAIGIVVDDAILVVENVERHLREGGVSGREAAKRAMNEVSGPIIASVLILCFVFVPVGFLGGITGQLYRQFSITIAVSVVVSGIVALTLSPALCAVLLRAEHTSSGGLFAVLRGSIDRTTNRYTRIVSGVLGRPLLSVAVFGLLIMLMMGLFRTIPTTFLPGEDQGYLPVFVQLPDGASMQRTEVILDQVEKFFLSFPAVNSVDTLVGQNFVFNTRGANSATMFVTLKPWDERDMHADALLGAAIEKFSTMRDALVLVFPPPPIDGLGTAGGFSLQIQDLKGGDVKAFGAAIQEFVERTRLEPSLQAVNSSFRGNSPRVYAHVDRERAKTLGVPVSDVFDTLQAYFGNFYINDFIKFNRVYRVQTEGEPAYRMSPENIRSIFVRAQNSQGARMIPLSTIVRTEITSGPDPVTHFNGFHTALVNGGAAPGYTSGQALATLERLAQEVLIPKGYGLDWSGISYQEKRASGQGTWVFAFALLMVFLIMAAQYESWSIPLGVMLSVPFGVLGALLAIWISGMSNDVYFQIGLVTLIGLAAKNAILIVEFANQQYQAGVDLVKAATEAARLRFRPIVMTSLAFILGVTPLVLATGAGAASRQSIGTGVMGGMLAATFLAPLFVPLFFVLITKMTRGKTTIDPEVEFDTSEQSDLERES